MCVIRDYTRSESRGYTHLARGAVLPMCYYFSFALFESGSHVVQGGHELRITLDILALLALPLGDLGLQVCTTKPG